MASTPQHAKPGEQREVLRRIATQMTNSCDVSEVLPPRGGVAAPAFFGQTPFAYAENPTSKNEGGDHA